MIGSKSLIDRINKSELPPISLSGSILFYQNSVKNLGLILNENLTWLHNSVVMCQRVHSSLSQLYRCTKYLPQSIRLTLGRSLVILLFEYRALVYFDINGKTAEILQRAQNSLVRFIFYKRKYDYVTM